MDDHPHSKTAEQMDDALDDSFPASDPPSWNMGRDRPPEQQIRKPEVVKRSGKKRGTTDTHNK
jgi:hypothetical protein